MARTSILRDILHIEHTTIGEIFLSHPDVCGNPTAITIDVKPHKRYRCLCPECGRQCPRYDYARGKECPSLWDVL